MSRRLQRLVLAFVALSTPAALGLESLMRAFLLPPAMEELRAWLRPQLAPVAWALVALAAGSIALAVFLQPRAYRGALRRQPAGLDPRSREAKARFDALLIVTSLPQIPALLATIAFTFGAEPLPTLLTIGLGTAGVLVVGATPRPR